MRARSRTNPVRPEVIDALDELERSLGDVARWEQLLTGKEVVPDWQRPDDTAEPRPRHLGPSHLVTGVALPEGDGDLDDVVSDLHDAIQSLDDRIDEIRPNAGSITFVEPNAVESMVGAGRELGQEPFERPDVTDYEVDPIEAPPLLRQARTVEPGRATIIHTAEEDAIDKRRRNGRMLTWTGLALLVGLGALFLLPGEDDDDPPAQELDSEVTATVEVVPTSELLPEYPFGELPTTTIAPVVTAPPATTQTTVRRATTTTRAPVVTTPTTPPTVATTTTTAPLEQPGPPPTDPPSTTTSTPILEE